MLELKTKKDLGKEASTLARGFELVRYRSTTYIPADYETRETGTPPQEDRKIWLPLTRDWIRRIAAAQFRTLFGSDGELASFDFMVMQNSTQWDEPVSSLLIRTPGGLKELDQNGVLGEPSKAFVPNTLTPMLNEDPKDKARVLATVEEWVGSKEEAESLLFHLATALAPGWSAVKYVLLLGEGRNGKSLLLKMLASVFGQENVSHVTRQHISEQSPVVTELNGKLLNIVYDGRSEYVKDSGLEKSLIAGEPVPIRKLYESTPTMVSTTALFIEGLNREPKSTDKSSALQKRLVRFQFSNVYALDHKFEKLMLSEKSLGAFLSLLIDHYVTEDELATKLSPTTRSLELQLEHMYTNSLAMQFLKYLEENDPLGAASILGTTMTELTQLFQSWRLKENDLGGWAEPDVQTLFQPILTTERKSQRVNGQPRKVRLVISFKPEGQAFIDSMKESEHETHDDILVGD